MLIQPVKECVILYVIGSIFLELYFILKKILVFMRSYSVYLTLQHLYTHKYYIDIRENRRGNQKWSIQRH